MKNTFIDDICGEVHFFLQGGFVVFHQILVFCCFMYLCIFPLLCPCLRSYHPPDASDASDARKKKQFMLLVCILTLFFTQNMQQS